MEGQGHKTLDKATAMTIDGDALWEFFGSKGKYQRWQIFFIFVAYTLTGAMPVLSGLFVGKDIRFKCADDNSTLLARHPNASIVQEECFITAIDRNSSQLISTEPCVDVTFEGNGTVLSYMAEWKTVCSDEELGQLPQMLTMIAMGLGATFLPQLGDRFGRKKLVFGSTIGITAASIATAFAKQFEVFLFLKFMSGFFSQGFMVPMMVLAMEMMKTEMRSFAILVLTMFWVNSTILLGAIGYFFREYDWRTLQIIIGSVTGASLIVFWFMDESLRWLLANGNVEKSEPIMKKVCRMNQKDYQQLLPSVLQHKGTILTEKEDQVELLSPLEISPPPTQELDVPETITDSSSHNLFHILKLRYMRTICFVMCYTWMVSALTYYGLILLSTSLAGDPYVNYFIGCFVEFPSALFMVYSIQKFGRKKTVITFQFISGVALLCAALLAHFTSPIGVSFIIQSCFTITGKFFVSGTFNAIWLYTPELYPTNLRNTGIGVSSASARFGATFSPFFTLLARKAVWAPGILFAVACFISSFLLTLVPETRWRELPNDVKEIEQWIEDDKKLKDKIGDKKLEKI